MVSDCLTPATDVYVYFILICDDYNYENRTLHLLGWGGGGLGWAGGGGGGGFFTYRLWPFTRHRLGGDKQITFCIDLFVVNKYELTRIPDRCTIVPASVRNSVMLASSGDVYKNQAAEAGGWAEPGGRAARPAHCSPLQQRCSQRHSCGSPGCRRRGRG